MDGGWWVLDITKSMLNSTQVEVLVEAELSLTKRRELPKKWPKKWEKSKKGGPLRKSKSPQFKMLIFEIRRGESEFSGFFQM